MEVVDVFKLSIDNRQFNAGISEAINKVADLLENLDSVGKRLNDILKVAGAKTVSAINRQINAIKSASKKEVAIIKEEIEAKRIFREREYREQAKALEKRLKAEQRALERTNKEKEKYLKWEIESRSSWQKILDAQDAKRIEAIERAKKASKTWVDRLRDAVKESFSLERAFRRISFVITATISYKVFYGFMRGIRSSISAAIEFERSLANISTMLTSRTIRYVKEFAVEISNLAKQFGESVITLSKGMYDILSAQISVQDAMFVLSSAAKAAIAGLTDVSVSIKPIIAILNAYNISAKRAGEVSDWLFVTVRKGITTFDDIARNIGKVISTAGLLGVAYEQVGAAIATMTRQGIRTRESTTALNRLLLTFARNTKTAREIGVKYGFTLSDISEGSYGLYNIILKLQDATDQEKAALAGSIRAFKALSAIINDTSGYYEDLRDHLSAVGATQEAFEKNMNTASKVVSKYRESLQGLGRTIGKVILPFLLSLIKLMTKVNNFLSRNAAWIKAVAVAISALILKVIVLRANTLLLSKAQMTLVFSSSALSKAVSVLGIVLKSSLGQFVLITAAVWGLIEGYKYLFRSEEEQAKRTEEMISQQLEQQDKYIALNRKIIDLADSYKSLVSDIGDLEEAGRDSNEKQERAAEIYELLSNIYPVLNRNVTDYSDRLIAVSKASDEAYEAIRKLTREQILNQKLLAEANRKRLESEFKEEKRRTEFIRKNEKQIVSRYNEAVDVLFKINVQKAQGKEYDKKAERHAEYIKQRYESIYNKIKEIEEVDRNIAELNDKLVKLSRGEEVDREEILNLERQISDTKQSLLDKEYDKTRKIADYQSLIEKIKSEILKIDNQLKRSVDGRVLLTLENKDLLQKELKLLRNQMQLQKDLAKLQKEPKAKKPKKEEDTELKNLQTKVKIQLSLYNISKITNKDREESLKNYINALNNLIKLLKKRTVSESDSVKRNNFLLQIENSELEVLRVLKSEEEDIDRLLLDELSTRYNHYKLMKQMEESITEYRKQIQEANSEMRGGLLKSLLKIFSVTRAYYEYIEQKASHKKAIDEEERRHKQILQDIGEEYEYKRLKIDLSNKDEKEKKEVSLRLEEEYNRKREEEAERHEAKVSDIKKQAQEDRNRAIKSSVNYIVNQLADIWNTYYQDRLDQIEQEKEEALKRLDEEARKGIMTKEEYEKKKADIENKAAMEKEKLAKQEHLIKLAQAVTNVAVAFTEALKAGPIIGPILAGMIAALGAVQIAMISAYKYAKGGLVKLYKYARGGLAGIIQGKSHEQGGVLINAEGGEFIYSKKATAGNERALYQLQSLLEHGIPLRAILSDIPMNTAYVPKPSTLTYQMGGVVDSGIDISGLSDEIRLMREAFENIQWQLVINGRSAGTLYKEGKDFYKKASV